MTAWPHKDPVWLAWWATVSPAQRAALVALETALRAAETAADATSDPDRAAMWHGVSDDIGHAIAGVEMTLRAPDAPDDAPEAVDPHTWAYHYLTAPE